MKQVREVSSSSAYVVLNKKGEDVAHVQYHCGASGSVQCDVWARKPGETHLSLVHQMRCHGGGYNKYAAALDGAMIEGYRMADNCGRVEPAAMKRRETIMRAYRKAYAAAPIPHTDPVWRAKVERVGARFANWREGTGYADAHFLPGLERLEAFGFRVIQAL